jgi:hypothetical protein
LSASARRHVLALPTPIAASLEVKVLGPVEVRKDGRRVAIGGPRQCATWRIWRFTQGNRTVEQLIDAVWRESAPASAVKTVPASVSRVGPRARQRRDRCRGGWIPARHPYKPTGGAGRAGRVPRHEAGWRRDSGGARNRRGARRSCVVHRVLWSEVGRMPRPRRVRSRCPGLRTEGLDDRGRVCHLLSGRVDERDDLPERQQRQDSRERHDQLA